MSEHTPITGELREAVEWEPTFCGPDRAMVPQPEFDRICDAIDAVHAGLERENAELRQRVAILDNGRGNMHIGDATVTIKPTLDWTGVARELRAIADTLGRGMLTADDVRDLIERHSDASGGNGRDFHNGAYVAIADELNATLGSCNCSNNCTNGERTDAPRLPHFWTHDGTLHIEATRMPTRIVVCEGGTCEFVPKRELDTSEAENAKLRELAGELWTYAEQELLCDENCPYGDTCDWMEPTVVCVFKRRMRELGVEVDV